MGLPFHSRYSGPTAGDEKNSHRHARMMMSMCRFPPFVYPVSMLHDARRCASWMLDSSGRVSGGVKACKGRQISTKRTAFVRTLRCSRCLQLDRACTSAPSPADPPADNPSTPSVSAPEGGGSRALLGCPVD